MARETSDFSKAIALYDESLSIWRNVRQRGIAAALGNLGMVSFARASTRWEGAGRGELLAIWRESGDQSGIAKELIALENVANAQGDERPLGRCTSRAWRSSATRDQRGIAVVLNNLG